MIPIIKWTLWQRRISTISWTIGTFFLIFISMITYPAFRDDAAELQKSFENLPDAALQLFGGNADFFSAVGFTNSQIFFLTLPMLLSILAIGLASSLLGREEQDQTLETLLARPVSRTQLLVAKAIAGCIILSFITAVSLATLFITSPLIDLHLSNWLMTKATIVCFLMVLSVAAVSFLLSASGRARSAAIGIGALLSFGGYVISSLAGTVDWLKGVSKIFPFDYYQSEAILRETYNYQNLIFFLLVIVLGGLLSWIAFRRRDLSS